MSAIPGEVIFGRVLRASVSVCILGLSFRYLGLQFSRIDPYAYLACTMAVCSVLGTVGHLLMWTTKDRLSASLYEFVSYSTYQIIFWLPRLYYGHTVRTICYQMQSEYKLIIALVLPVIGFVISLALMSYDFFTVKFGPVEDLYNNVPLPDDFPYPNIPLRDVTTNTMLVVTLITVGYQYALFVMAIKVLKSQTVKRKATKRILISFLFTFVCNLVSMAGSKIFADNTGYNYTNIVSEIGSILGPLLPLIMKKRDDMKKTKDEKKSVSTITTLSSAPLGASTIAKNENA